MRALWTTLVFALLLAPPAGAQPVCEKPNMMIVQDRSGSMSGTKWIQAKNAIQFILNNYSGSLRFGLDMFPSNNDCGAGSIQVDLGDNMASAIMAALNGTDANGMTPTAATLMVLNSYRPLKDIDRRNFVMLVTDGCDTCADDHADDPVAATADLYNSGIRTFVIGFGLGSGDCSDWQSILSNIAAAGHTGNYHFADDEAQLRQAMDAIINEALVEICDDRDNDCDGDVDETWPDKGTLCEITQGGCTATGVWVCNPTQDGLVCSAQLNPTPEVCDGLDNDCDGVIDNGFPDADADGHTICTDCCDSGTEAMLGCTAATAPNIYPGAVEICNGYDDNCNGTVDEDDPQAGTPCGECTAGEQPPCYTDEGECRPGELICMSGSLECLGEINPVEEVCDGLDNDCNGVPDDHATDEICDDGIDNDCDGDTDGWDSDCGGACHPGQQEPCGSAEGDCEMGVRTCDQNGEWGPCEGGWGPSDEVCDGRDNDCDGETDEDAVAEICDDDIDNDCDGLTDSMDPDCGECTPGETRTCGSNVGACQEGVQTCTASARWTTCVGEIGPVPEVCDARDNDCDGATDEGYLCEGYDACLCGACSPPCSAGECPAGSLVCVNNWCVDDACCGIYCEAGLECDENGQCVDRCETEAIQCAAGEDCRMGICVPADCYTPGHECQASQICIEGVCQPDSCADVDCSDAEYCVGGTCLPVACTDCGPDEACEAGECVESLCAGVRCEAGQVCLEGECAADPCQGVYCPVGTACQDGTCVGDPCMGISCPEDSTCVDGWCVGTDPGPVDGGTDAGSDAGVDAGRDAGPGDTGGQDSGPGTDRDDGGSDGCGCGSGQGRGPASLIILLLMALAGVRRLRPSGA